MGEFRPWDASIRWVAENTAVLATVDPAAPLDDLDQLAAVAGDARVVAIGEGAHFVNEFSDARCRLARYLGERCGFTVFAFEFGFSEAFAIDEWLRRGGDVEELANIDASALEWGASAVLSWLSGYNRSGSRPLGFAGIDLPAAGGSLRPALEPVAEYLRAVADPVAVTAVEKVLALSDDFLETTGSGVAAAPGWARLDTAAKDALTAALARTRIRMTALEPQYVARGGQDGFDIALRRLDAVCHADYMFRAVAALTSGADTAGDLSAREVFLAESVLWHLARRGPEERVILVAHNNHIQKAPVRFDNGPTVLPMGLHLRRALGSDYRAIALTHSDDHVAEMYPSPGHAAGFAVRDTALDPPRPGTVESALTRAGFGDQITMTDLRRPPDDTETGPLLTGIRSQSTTLELSVTDAFDAVLCLPTVTTDDTIGFGGSVDR